MGNYSRKLYEFMRKGKLPGPVELGGTVNSDSVFCLLKDSSDKILLCTGTTAPTDASPGYAKGCIFIKTNAGAGVSGLYENVGTSTSCNFDPINASSGNTVWNDIGDAATDGSVSFETTSQTITGAVTDKDMLIVKNTGNFGDVSVMKVAQDTGNPTDGTVLEVVTSDANCDLMSLVGKDGEEVINIGPTGVITLKPYAVTDDGILFNVPAAYTGQLIKVSDTIVGTDGEGAVIDAKTTANMASGATLIRVGAETGTLAGATEGFLLKLVDSSGAKATSYCVSIESTNNEALYVKSGKAKFEEMAQFVGGIDCDGGVDIDLATNADLVNIDNAAADLAAGSGIVTIFGSAAAGQTNDSALLRLVRKADGDAQDTFLLCQDNSTGAAGNGDTKFKVGANGNTTIAGLTTMSGGGSLGAPTELTIGASDDITITGSYHTVDTAGDASSDDLVTINGGSNGQVLVLRAENSARTVVLKHGTGNIQCGSDISLDNAYDTVTLLYDSATSMWLLLASSNNGS